MFLMNFLRALADLGFYYSFAGIVSTQAGGHLALALLLLQSGCFALSSALRRSRVLRVIALAPALCLFFLPAGLADRIVSVPPAVYMAYLAWTDGYQLSWNRQVDQLKLFGKVFLAVGWPLALFGLWDSVLSAGIPAAMVTAAASVLLTRSLRHEPGVYLQPRYQLVNFLSVLLLALAALALGSEQAVRGAAFVLGSVYNAVIAPLLLGAALAIGYLLSWLVPLLKWLIGSFKPPGERESPDLAEAALAEELEKLAEGVDPQLPEPLQRAAVAVGIILAAAVLFLLFRWMARRRYEGERHAAALVRSDLPGRETRERSRAGGGYAGRIRRQYRAFLRLCRGQGLEFAVSDTSTDIGERALGAFPDEEAMAGLRDLYQRARYQGDASREDYQRFKMLLGTLKKAR